MPVPPLDDRLAYTGFVALMALHRLVELRQSADNADRLRARGAREYGANLHPWLVASQVAYFLSLAAELWILRPPLIFPLAAGAAGLFALSTALRLWTIRSLGERWTTRVLRVPGDPIERRGPYRILKHPNEVAVGVECLALPLIHSCWITSLVFSGAHVVLARQRTRTADLAWREGERNRNRSRARR